MAEDNTRIGTTDVIFGIADSSWGYFDNFELSYEGEKLEIKNGESKTIGVEYFDKKLKATGTCEINTTGTPYTDTHPVGAAITLTLKDTSEITIYIDSWKKMWERSGTAKYSFEATKYPNLATSST
jgi:hypothetical protein